MVLLDLMHNLFQGTAQTIARDLWIRKNILTSSALNLIESRLKKVSVLTGLGRILVSINKGCFLTAEQWKNWTIYFSIYFLGDILPKEQLENCRHFVLACRCLCKYSVSTDDINIHRYQTIRVESNITHSAGGFRGVGGVRKVGGQRLHVRRSWCKI